VVVAVMLSKAAAPKLPLGWAKAEVSGMLNISTRSSAEILSDTLSASFFDFNAVLI